MQAILILGRMLVSGLGRLQLGRLQELQMVTLQELQLARLFQQWMPQEVQLPTLAHMVVMVLRTAQQWVQWDLMQACRVLTVVLQTQTLGYRLDLRR